MPDVTTEPNDEDEPAVGDRVSVVLDGIVTGVNQHGVIDIDLHEHGEVRMDEAERSRIEVMERA